MSGFNINQYRSQIESVDLQESVAGGRSVARYCLDYKAKKPESKDKLYPHGTKFIFRPLTFVNLGLDAEHLARPEGAKPLLVKYRNMFLAYRPKEAAPNSPPILSFEAQIAYPYDPEKKHLCGLEVSAGHPVYTMTDAAGLPLGANWTGGPITYSTTQGPKTENNPHKLITRVRIPILHLATLMPSASGHGSGTTEVVAPENAVKWIELSQRDFTKMLEVRRSGTLASGISSDFNPYTQIPDYNMSLQIVQPTTRMAGVDREYALSDFAMAIPAGASDDVLPHQNAGLVIDLLGKIPESELWSSENPDAPYMPFSAWFPEYSEAIDKDINAVVEEMMDYERTLAYVEAELSSERFTTVHDYWSRPVASVGGGMSATNAPAPMAPAPAVAPVAPAPRVAPVAPVAPVARVSDNTPTPDDQRAEELDTSGPAIDVEEVVAHVETPPVTAPVASRPRPGAARPAASPSGSRPTPRGK